MKVLISDKLSQQGKDILQRRGVEFEEKTGLTPEELKEAIGQYDGIIIRSGTKLTRDVLENAGQLKAIARAGVGLDNVDIPTATEKGIVVMNTPGGNTVSTAELTFSMLLALSRKIPQAWDSLRKGEWKRSKFRGVEVRNKTLGIIGLGRIGTQLSKYAKAFDMRVLGYDPYVSAERAQQIGVEMVDLEQLFGESDYISVHTPLTAETKDLLGKEAIGKMKPGARILNCARGGIANEEALIEALQEGKLAGAAVDVWTKEPPSGNPLLEMENVVATPHLGASTTEAQDNVAVEAAELIADFLLEGKVKNAANVPAVDEKVLDQLRPYIFLSDKLGSLTAQMLKGNLQTLEVTYSGELEQTDVAPLTVGMLKGFLGHVLDSDVNEVNAPSKAKERGIQVVESKTSKSEDFAALVKVVAKSDVEEVSVAGTVFGKKNDPRIVRVNDFHVDATPEGSLIIITNWDRPGAVGKIGTTLGDSSVNIADMTLGRKKAGETAVTLLNIDGDIPDNVVEELQQLDEVIDTKVVHL
jgi:D-3-phosphoglycerate dehydrogenase